MSKKVLKIMCGAVLAASLSASAMAAAVPLINGPVDPSTLSSTFNSVIQSVNTNVSGIIAFLPTAGTTLTTAATTLFAYTAPGNAISVGDLFHVKAWGSNSADANVKTITFNYGSISCAQVVTGSGNTWYADFYVGKVGTNSQNYHCVGLTGTTPIAVVLGTGAVVDTSAVTINVQATAATSGTITVSGAYLEQLR